jgi:15-cis-phytoene synthase
VPVGSTRYWSWLFAPQSVRAPLIGVYALLAEWQALTDPTTEPSVAHLKLAWWQEEMQRLERRSGVHPISTYLASLPGAASADFSSLRVAVRTAVDQIGGAPLEHGADLEAQSQALWGDPMALATVLGSPAIATISLRSCTSALAAGEHLSAALQNYRRAAKSGRVSFAIDELLSMGIENADLVAESPSPALQAYLVQTRGRAQEYFRLAANALPRPLKASCRHLLVTAALGLEHLGLGSSSIERRRPLRDMLLAWSTARRAR